MLADLVDLVWEGRDPALGRGTFPPHLAASAALHDPALGPFLFRAALVYRSAGVILLDTPLHWDRARNAVVVTAREQRALDDRLALARRATREAVMPVRFGIGEVLAGPLYGGAVAALTGGAPEAVAAAAAWVFDPVAAPTPGARPDAIAFHSIALPRTMTLKLEPTTRCNFSCGFCYGRHLEQGDLTLADFETMLERFPDLRAVELTGEGEPLLNKDIYGFIAQASQRALHTHITTNGSALTERNIDKLLDAGLKSLAVSMESLDPEKFRQYRPGGSVEQTRAGIARVVARKRERGADLAVSLWVTLMRNTVGEMPAFQRFAHEAGVDHFECFQTLNPMPSYGKFYDRQLRDNMLAEDEVARLIADPATDPEVTAALRSATAVYRQSSCGIFMGTAMVNWQGEMTPCCLLKVPDQPSLGNLRHESLDAIWAKPAFETFRFALLHGIVLESCKGCPDVAAARAGWVAEPC